MTTADQCYAWNKFFVEKKSLEKHLNVCGHIPGNMNNFENQNIQTFLENVKFVGDLPFFIYFDFESTSGKKVYNFDEDRTLYPVSYAFVVAFHRCLNIEKIFVVKSFNHIFEQLNDVGYLSDEMLPYFDSITARQLRDCAQAVYAKKERHSLSEMFSCELKFVINLLIKWLAEKYFRRYREFDFFSKQKFKRENLLD